MTGAPAALEAGAILGRYRLERLLGSGATSEVYVATHVQLERRVAIKILLPSLLVTDASVQRMLQEARAVNAVRHPNVTEIFDFIEETEAPRLALVMEYVGGPSLEALSGFEFSFEQALALGLQLVSGVQAAHAAGVIHRDLKPGNLLLTTDPRERPPDTIPKLKLIDFGIAKLAGVGEPTMAGRPLGTPAFMAPEQISGTEASSPATDVYAIGEILFELYSGQRAFPQRNSTEVMRAKLRGQKPRLVFLPSVPATAQSVLGPLIDRALSVAQEERPSTTELRQALVELAPWPEVASPRRASIWAQADSPETRAWIEALDSGTPVSRPAVDEPTQPPVLENKAPRGSRKLERAALPPAAETAAIERPIHGVMEAATEVAFSPWSGKPTGASRLIEDVPADRVSTAETLDSLMGLDETFDEPKVPQRSQDEIRAAVLDVVPRFDSPAPTLLPKELVTAPGQAARSESARPEPAPTARPEPAPAARPEAIARPSRDAVPITAPVREAVQTRGASQRLHLLAIVLAVTAVVMAGVALWLRLRATR